MIKIIFVTVAVLLFAFPLFAELKLDLETGLAESGYNDVKIPGNTGTPFSISDDLNAKSAIFYRVTVIKDISEKSSIEMLFAPLTLKADGILGKNISFAGSNFAKGAKVDAVYRFDSYRVRYLYKIHESRKSVFKLGFTAKIRDASIKLSDSLVTAEKKNTGLVPLAAFKWERKLSDKFSGLFEGDALAAPQGRAEDILLALQYKASSKASIKAGYRIVEGGADNDEVYNFALINYFIIGITLSL